MKHCLLTLAIALFVISFVIGQGTVELNLMDYSALLEDYNGISGIDFRGDTLYAASDRYGVYRFHIKMGPKGSLKGSSFIDSLKVSDLSHFESVKLGQGKTIWLSIETDSAEKPLTYLVRGTILNKEIKIEERIERVGHSPLRDNTGIEGFAVSDDAIYYSIERPYAGKKDSTYFYKISFDKKMISTMLYPMQTINGFDEGKDQCAYLDNGVSEIVQISKDHFLILERAFSELSEPCIKPTGETYVRIFEAKVTSRNTLSKRLIFDMNQNKDSFKLKIKRDKGLIDNYEGMCFGPDLDGFRTLLLVSDNNLNRGIQYTDLLVFKTNIPSLKR